MHESTERGRNRDLRASALWGTGARGGDSRSSALWGKGGRSFVVTAVAVLALGAPLAATASPGKDRPPVFSHDRNATFVAPDLVTRAKAKPNEKIRVIIQSNYGTSDALGKARGLGSLLRVTRQLNLVNGIAVDLPARLVTLLSKLPGITVVPDAPVKLSGSVLPFTSGQLWPHENGNAFLWNPSVKAPTIAIVDSGIDKTRADFGSRVVADVNLSQLAGNSPGDGRGHGTFVAGLAAGSAARYAGASPTSDIVSLDVMDDQGMALTSDVIAACSWILQNKDTYNIKVANFSLHSTYPSNFGRDPLDRAVERLWFAGVTVVAAAGNYGNADGTPSGVHYAPGNDPFVITVGALDLGKTGTIRDDGMADWSAYGHTYDGFQKPEIAAAGRYMVGPVSAGATLAQQRPEKIVAPGYMELSGTSFAAPVVSGTVAQLLARNPAWGPDQVKGALMKSARPVPRAHAGQAGVGQINAVTSLLTRSVPNPNRALEQFLTADPAGGSVPVFDAVSWYDAATSDVSWDSVSWSDVSWSDVSWDSVSWSDVSWDSVSWSDVSWSDVSWSDVSWSDSSKEDAVLAEEPSGGEGMQLDELSAADLASDPDLNVDPSLVDPALELLLTPLP